LDGSDSQNSDPDAISYRDMGSFLESVEKQAYVIAVASCGDQHTALDIVQDAMFNMVRSYSDKPATEWRKLFFRILNNRVTDAHRKRGFSKMTRWFGNHRLNEPSDTDAVDQLESDSFDPASLADSLNLSAEIEQALAQLSIKQQQALLHRLWLGLSVNETATVMGISEGSVKTHLSRAVAEMRKQLKEFYSS
jgi:RNA polymerase sigma-70 factor (ECF subfamily)